MNQFSLDDIINTASEVFNNEDIFKHNMTICYKLPPKIVDKLNEEFFYRFVKSKEEITYSDIVEVTINDINFKFEKSE
jgi:hypothetical protein